MERLTQKSDKMIWLKDQGLKIEPCEMNSHHCRMILEKLADYEDLEEQGLLVRFDAIGKEDMGESCYRLEDIGRIVFLTHEEAEKLEEMKNND